MKVVAALLVMLLVSFIISYTLVPDDYCATHRYSPSCTSYGKENLRRANEANRGAER